MFCAIAEYQKTPAQRKIPKFHLTFCCGNAVETNSFPVETHNLFERPTVFSEPGNWNYGILCNGVHWYAIQIRWMFSIWYIA